MESGYQAVLKELTRKGCEYLVIGAVGMALSGYARATFDLDILPSLEEENLDILLKVMEEAGYVPRVPVDPLDLKDPAKREIWAKEKGAKVFTFIQPKDPLRTVDVMIYHPLDFRKAFARRREVEVGGTPVFVASLEDLMALKETEREKDRLDLEVLSRLKEREDEG
jgi:predicted nucleotidyltransferase